MAEPGDAGRIRPLTELDIGSVVRIDEKLLGRYRPAVWEGRVGYYLRRDPEASRVAEVGGRVVGFMLGEVRGGEFGQEEPTGWIEPNSVLACARMMPSRCRARSSPMLAGFSYLGWPRSGPISIAGATWHSSCAHRQNGGSVGKKRSHCARRVS